jgi:hypothetical protein
VCSVDENCIDHQVLLRVLGHVALRLGSVKPDAEGYLASPELHHSLVFFYEVQSPACAAARALADSCFRSLQAVHKMQNSPTAPSTASAHDEFASGLRAWLDEIVKLAQDQKVQTQNNLQSLDENAYLAHTLKDMLDMGERPSVDAEQRKDAENQIYQIESLHKENESLRRQNAALKASFSNAMQQMQQMALLQHIRTPSMSIPSYSPLGSPYSPLNVIQMLSLFQQQQQHQPTMPPPHH